MVSVRVWLPAIPPMLATIGMSTANATTCSRVFSNKPMTQEASNAVARLIPSHTARRRALGITGANKSSSSRSPAMCSMCSEARSSITSSTSSTVIRPSSCLSSRTTATEMRSRRSNRRTTSACDASACTTGPSCMTAPTVRPGSLVSSVASGSWPRYRRSRSITMRWSVWSGKDSRRRR